MKTNVVRYKRLNVGFDLEKCAPTATATSSVWTKPAFHVRTNARLDSTVLSRENKRFALVPATANGLSSAIVAASFTAAPTTPSRPPSWTLLTKPSALASAAPNLRPVKHSSRTADWLPTIFGSLCSVPTSATMPIWTS